MKWLDSQNCYLTMHKVKAMLNSIAPQLRYLQENHLQINQCEQSVILSSQIFS